MQIANMYKTPQTLYFLFLEEYTNDFQVCVKLSQEKHQSLWNLSNLVLIILWAHQWIAK